MDSLCTCPSPLGEITLASDGRALIGLWFSGQRFDRLGLQPGAEMRELPVFAEARRWLALYFDGRKPDFTPPLSFRGTDFQKEVWEMLLTIPYGETVTYGELAARLERQGGKRCSARAVGGAVGRNPISLMVPCHRVLGAGGALTGYAGGMDRKRRLLALEGVCLP